MMELLYRLRPVLNLVLTAVLLLALRKLIWCIRCLWRHSHGRPMPEPIPWLPRQSGRIFEAHIRGADEQQHDGR